MKGFATILLLSLGMVSCTPGTERGTSTGQSDEDATPQEIVTHMPPVGRVEFDCIVKRFNDRFKLLPLEAPEPIKPLPFKLSVADHNAALSSCSTADGDQAGVIVHYGLKNGSLVYGLEYVCLEKVGDPGSYDASPIRKELYTVIDGAWTTVDSTQWFKDHREPFTDSVIVDPLALDNFRILQAGDVRAITFPHHTELRLLLQDNTPLPVDSLEIVPTAEFWSPPTGQAYIRKGVAWKVVGITLDDEDHGTSGFKHRAANLGAPCPAYCPPQRITFAKTGTDGCANN